MQQQQQQQQQLEMQQTNEEHLTQNNLNKNIEVNGKVRAAA